MSVISRTGIAIVRVEEETIGTDPQVLHVWIPTTKRVILYALAVIYAKEAGRVTIRPPRPRTKPNARPIDGRDWQHTDVDRWAAQMLIHRYTDAHEQSDPIGMRHKAACLVSRAPIPLPRVSVARADAVVHALARRVPRRDQPTEGKLIVSANPKSFADRLGITRGAVARNLRPAELSDESISALVANPPPWLVSERTRKHQLATGAVANRPLQHAGTVTKNKAGPAKMKWAQIFVSQTSIALEYGISAIAFGKLLASVGLKVGAAPSPAALADGIATETPMRSGIMTYRWHRDQVVAALTAAGHQRIGRAEHQALVARTKARQIVRELAEMEAAGDDKLAYLYYDSFGKPTRRLIDQIRGE